MATHDTQGFLARESGKTVQKFAVNVSAGAADAGKLPALGATGRLDLTMLPVGVGVQTVAAKGSEILTSGDFVNFHDDAGTFSARKADNATAKRADGFVKASTVVADDVLVYPLDGLNDARVGMTAGAAYWLGTAGGIISTPLDETDDTNAGKLSQYLGYAKSATEMITTDSDAVTL